MTTWPELADRLQHTLHLSIPPVGIGFSEQAPTNVQAFEEPAPTPSDDGRTGRVPAGCVFWMHATERTFTTRPDDHGNCSVGMYTHGMLSFEEAAGRGDVATLLETGWVTAEAAQTIPHVPESPAYVTYGPLSQCDWDPDVVLIRVNGRQLMVLHDTLPTMRIEGKPQCHIIALAYSGEPAASVGCALSRVRTGMPPTEMTCALPAATLAEICDRIERTDATDDAVMTYAAADARRFARM